MIERLLPMRRHGTRGRPCFSPLLLRVLQSRRQPPHRRHPLDADVACLSHRWGRDDCFSCSLAGSTLGNLVPTQGLKSGRFKAGPQLLGATTTSVHATVRRPCPAFVIFVTYPSEIPGDCGIGPGVCVFVMRREICRTFPRERRPVLVPVLAAGLNRSFRFPIEKNRPNRGRCQCIAARGLRPARRSDPGKNELEDRVERHPYP